MFFDQSSADVIIRPARGKPPKTNCGHYGERSEREEEQLVYAHGTGGRAGEK